MFTLCFVAISLSGVLGHDSVLPAAVKQGLANSYNRSASLVNIAIQTDFDENSVVFLDMLDEVLVEKWNFQVQLDVNNEETQAVGDYNLWLIDSYRAFRLMLPLIRTYQGDSPVFYFIILKFPQNRKILKSMQKMFSDLFQLMVANVNIIVESTSIEALFYTFFPYQESVCRSTVPTLVNRLINKTLVNRRIFPPKADNFHGCPIRIAARNKTSLIEVINREGTVEIRGLEGKLVKEFATKFNFTLEFHRLEGKKDWNSFVYSNGTATGPYKMLEKGEVDVMVGSYYHEPSQDRSFTPSTTHIFSIVVIALRHPHYSPATLLWIFKPLGRRAWICTLTLLFITFLCTTIVTNNARLSKFLRLQSNRSSIINLLEITLGMSIKFLPKTNFFRLNFIIWSLGVLILRTAYQGKMFDSYRRVHDTYMPRTIGQLLNQNYVIYSRPRYARMIYEMNGLRSVSYRYTTNVSVVLNSTQKSALVASLVHITAVLTPKQMESVVLESVHNQLICMVFQKHSIMVPRVNKIVQWLDNGGILQRWRKQYNFIIKKPSRTQHACIQGPITLTRFKYIFISLAMVYLLICMIFLVELFWHRLRRTRKQQRT